MGWEDHHLHSFEIGRQSYEPFDEDDDDDGEAVDEDSVILADLVEARTSFSYEYDFGDSWNHEIVVESVGSVPQALKMAVCLDGQRACPPEDCGGVHGFVRFLEAIGDPDHDEHHDYLNRVGGSFDPTSFDLAAVNAAFQRVR
jgi:hypothetical protein